MAQPVLEERRKPELHVGYVGEAECGAPDLFRQYADRCDVGAVGAVAVVDLAGVAGVRLVSALLTTLTAVFVYLTARRLFNRQVALWGILIFGLTGGSISLGQLAVYDVLMLPLLAVAFFCLIAAAQSEGRAAWAYLVSGALAYSAAALAKYSAIFYLPAICLTAAALYAMQRRWRGIVQLVTSFLIPVGVILGAYLLLYFPDVIQILTGKSVIQAAPPSVVVQTINDEIGIVILVALLGLGAVIATAWHGSRSGFAAVVAFFVRPDALSGLVTLSCFDRGDDDGTASPSLAGCGSIFGAPGSGAGVRLRLRPGPGIQPGCSSSSSTVVAIPPHP